MVIADVMGNNWVKRQIRKCNLLIWPHDYNNVTMRRCSGQKGSGSMAMLHTMLSIKTEFMGAELLSMTEILNNMPCEISFTFLANLARQYRVVKLLGQSDQV